MEPVPFPREWVEDAVLAVYATDMWGNWNKNDTVAPYIKIVRRVPETVFESDSVTIYILVSDWSEISNVTLRYFDGAVWHSVSAIFDETTHLYYAVIPPCKAGTTIKYSVYAEDVYGNGITYSDKYCTYTTIPVTTSTTVPATTPETTTSETMTTPVTTTKTTTTSATTPVTTPPTVMSEYPLYMVILILLVLAVVSIILVKKKFTKQQA